MAPDSQHRLRNIRTAAVVVVSLVALLTACGRTYWATVNPCSLLTTAEVATTLDATKLDTIDAHPSSDGKASYCTYQVGGQQTLVVIQLDKQLSTPAALKTAVAQTNGFT